MKLGILKEQHDSRVSIVPALYWVSSGMVLGIERLCRAGCRRAILLYG
jgi:hypothetical protein